MKNTPIVTEGHLDNGVLTIDKGGVRLRMKNSAPHPGALQNIMNSWPIAAIYLPLENFPSATNCELNEKHTFDTSRLPFRVYGTATAALCRQYGSPRRLDDYIDSSLVKDSDLCIVGTQWQVLP
eukprot:Gregarina_sp_Poly_1__8255@NODE_4811_length_484_cov_5_211031_g3307_i0_p1_GENE_NODE_4811_length_484_cov_5_211031_g3307_i0NODE_4811_length_484_cov_5_211031_g3307_i0_p1_ORF_typecomplete_len124_score6_93_NODE_4811_length_484_cov_5_211031_g3307_i0113484